MTNRITQLLAHNDGMVRRLIAAGEWALACDALEEAGGETVDVLALYATSLPQESITLTLIGEASPATREQLAQSLASMRRSNYIVLPEGVTIEATPPNPAEDDSLRPLLAAWAETRISRELAGRVRAWRIDGAIVLNAESINDGYYPFQNAAIARRDLKRRVLAEFDGVAVITYRAAIPLEQIEGAASEFLAGTDIRPDLSWEPTDPPWPYRHVQHGGATVWEYPKGTIIRFTQKVKPSDLIPPEA